MLSQSGEDGCPCRHRFTVRQLRVAAQLLQRMTQGMAEVQDRTFTGIPLVTLHHISLDGDTFKDHVLDHLGGILLFQAFKQLPAADTAVLHHLAQTVTEEGLRQRLKGIGVDQHPDGLPESAHQVLPARQVHACFTADGGIHLCQQAGGNLHEVDAPQIACRRKACHITCHTAAQSHDQVGTGDIMFKQVEVQTFNGGKTLGSFSGLKDKQ